MIWPILATIIPPNLLENHSSSTPKKSGMVMPARKKELLRHIFISAPDTRFRL